MTLDKTSLHAQGGRGSVGRTSAPDIFQSKRGYSLFFSSTFASIKQGWMAVMHALSSMVSHPSLTVQSMVLTALFLMSLGIISSVFASRTVDTLFSLSTVLVPSAVMSTDSAINAASSPAVYQLAWQAVALVVLMAFSALISFCILQGLAWRSSYRIAGNRAVIEGNIWKFLASFSRLSFWIFPFFLLYEGLAFIRDFRELSLERMPGLVVWNPSIVVSILGVLLVYMCMLAFASIFQQPPWTGWSALKRSWTRGVVHIAATLPSLIPLLIISGIVEWITRFLVGLGPGAMVLGVLLVLWWWTFAVATFIILCEGDT